MLFSNVEINIYNILRSYEASVRRSCYVEDVRDLLNSYGAGFSFVPDLFITQEGILLLAGGCFD
jgi:hypothetical protein